MPAVYPVTTSSLINKYSAMLPQMEAELLLSLAFSCTKNELYIDERRPGERELKLADELVRRRLAGEPLQYILGCAEFMDMDFYVTKDVLIPRPETELLVKKTLFFAKQLLSSGHTGPVKILDLCTGCGNIAVSLARSMTGLEITAADISAEALNIARKNSIAHGVGHIDFLRGDLFDALKGKTIDKNYKFDIIVSNPPYVKSHAIEFLQKEVRHEPVRSLDGGHGGLDFYIRIADRAPAYLRKGGALFLEIGFGQARDIEGIFASKKVFGIRGIEKDFSGIERVVWIDLL